MQYKYEHQDKEIYIWTHYYMPLRIALQQSFETKAGLISYRSNDKHHLPHG